MGSGERSDRGRTHLDIPIAGLAKDRKHRTSELLYGFPPLTIGVKQSTPLFHLLENIQNEVTPLRHHLPPGQTKQESGGVRFGQYQGNRRKKKDRPAENIQSVSRIRQASLEEIAAVVGEAAAKNIKEKSQQNKRDFLPLHTSTTGTCSASYQSRQEAGNILSIVEAETLPINN